MCWVMKTASGPARDWLKKYNTFLTPPPINLSGDSSYINSVMIAGLGFTAKNRSLTEYADKSALFFRAPFYLYRVFQSKNAI